MRHETHHRYSANSRCLFPSLRTFGNEQRRQLNQFTVCVCLLEWIVPLWRCINTLLNLYLRSVKSAFLLCDKSLTCRIITDNGIITWIWVFVCLSSSTWEEGAFGVRNWKKILRGMCLYLLAVYILVPVQWCGVRFPSPTIDETSSIIQVKR